MAKSPKAPKKQLDSFLEHELSGMGPGVKEENEQ